MTRTTWSALFVCGALVGCVRPPAPIDVAPLQPISVADAQAADLHGQLVRWGGTLVSTTVGPADTCFEIVSRPLDDQARPLLTDATTGRFVACAPGFYDPAVYAEGRDVTVVGTLADSTTGRIGDRPYTFPKVADAAVYLWPQRPPQVVYYPVGVGPFWYDPFWPMWPWW